MLKQKTTTSRLFFLVVPLTVFLITPNIHDVHGILRLIGLVVGTYLILILNPKGVVVKNKVQTLLWMLVLGYVIIQIILKNDFQQFLLGSYQRNGGLIALVCFALIFTLISNYQTSLDKIFIQTVIITLYGLVVFGFLEEYSLLPFKIQSKYEGTLSLTLVNPNFASSYLAIAIFVFLIYSVQLSAKKRVFNTILVIPILFIFTQTGSLQGYLLMILNTSLFIFYKRNYIFRALKRFKILVFFVIGTLLVFLLVNSNQIFSWIRENGSVNQRINYWRLAINIWRDHFFTGIGLESLRDYAPRYRSEVLVRQEGIFTNPDRAHNVFLDHFVQGGVFIGLIWLAFVSIISFLAIKNLLNKTQNLSINEFLIIMIWFGYVAQSAISVDHLALTLLGIISGAIITKSSMPDGMPIGQKREGKFQNYSVFMLISFFTFSVIIFLVQVVRYEYWALDVIARKNPANLQKIYNSRIVVPQTLEDISVEIAKSKNFEVGFTFAEKLLKHRPSSHQGFYMLSVYFENKLDFRLAKDNMLQALKLDPYNSVYLLSMAIYEYQLNNFILAKDYFLRAKDINPNQEGLDIVSKYITY
jgi:O-antigen ligase